MVHDNRNLVKYEQKLGSRYSATVFVGRMARKLAEKYDNVISHAEALSWILSGSVPDVVSHYTERIKQREQRPLKYAQEYLTNIMDDRVRTSVYKSLEKSKEEGHLVYHYEEVYDEFRQARVRILTRKLWNELHEMHELSW